MGSIVWVRRRNGSWWPGKVLGPDELSSTHLMSPRSGTPVKLLGREDASVDWYNLEKSKRVKAFRCGEFDDCIEKAEASLGLPAKKREREKYARRDDAILHALRLEKEFLEKKYGDVGDYSISVKNCSSSYVVKDLATSGTLENGTSEHGSLKFWPFQRKTGLSVGNWNNHSPSSSRKGRSVDLQASLYSEVKPLLRDLQDLGMKNVQPKLMATSSAALNDSHEMMIDDEGHAFGSSSDADSENTSARVKGLMYGPSANNQEFRSNPNWHTDYLHNGGNYAQVKRSRASCLPSESNFFKAMEGSPSGQIEIFGSLIQKGTRHSGHNGFRYKLPSASSEDTESDSSETDSQEHAMDAEMKRNSGTFDPMDPQSRPPPNQPDMLEDESLSSGDEDSMSPEYAPPFPHHNPICKDRTSRWQLKRKRNARSSPRKSVDRLISTSYQNAGGRPLWRRRNDGMSYYQVNNNGFPSDVEFFDNDDVQTPREREHGNNRGCLSNPQSAIRRHEVFLGDDSMETWMWRDRFSGGFWGARNGGGFSPFHTGGRRGRIMLLDVDLKVEAQHRRDERVPWVSITSDLNGNSIVGHPIGVEKLEDGSTDYLLSTVYGFGNPDFDNYRNSRMMVPPLRHATKRTSANVLQVPRPNVFSSLPGEDDDNLYCDEDQRIYRTAVAGLPAQRNNCLVHKLSSPSNKNKKKIGKKSSLCPTLKFRPLTSIGIGQSLVSDDLRDDSFFNDDDYNMDLGSAGPPTVACIPLKLVFSRLLEAVGKPPTTGF